MNKYILYITLFTHFACSERTEKKEPVSERNNLKQVISDKLKYTLIRDNLYRDDDENLYLRAENNEDFEHGTKHNVWLKTVYCDTCMKPTEDGFADIKELKDFVDVATFHYDTTYESEGLVIYADKRYTYRHKLMADGGTITLEEK